MTQNRHLQEEGNFFGIRGIRMKVLVTGGCGYVGSHCIRQLIEQGHEVVVLDSLVYGHKAAIGDGISFYEGDVGDTDLVKRVLRDHGIELVMHFAAYAYVGESVTDPRKYYENNLGATLSLLGAMLDLGVKQFVFSSTCATFGTPKALPITEDTAQVPINPYGKTKLDVEHALRSYARAYGLSFASLRYFNAAGADASGEIGEDHTPETHLIPLVMDVALGKREKVLVFGDDYPTPDGTCLRDYIHVNDLAKAHIACFEKLSEGEGVELFYNLGIGKPYSVLEVIQAAQKVTGQEIAYEIAPRRAGDPASLYASAGKAKAELGWMPEYTDIEAILATAWDWHRAHPDGYRSKAKR